MTIKLRTRPVKGNIYIKRSNNTKYTIINVSKHIDNELSYNLYTIEFINKDGDLETKEVKSDFFHDLYFQYNLNIN